ncbi:MAG: mRNA interferase [bacterium]|nr:MAG: mRNA interferase [bacterium]
MNKGDIYSVKIPSVGGHEQAGLRPAIIVQETGFDKLPTVLIVPLTSKLKASDFPLTFMIEPDGKNNLKVSSVALVFQLRAIDKSRLKTKIGRLDPPRLKLLNASLIKMMSLDSLAYTKFYAFEPFIIWID